MPESKDKDIRKHKFLLNWTSALYHLFRQYYRFGLAETYVKTWRTHTASQLGAVTAVTISEAHLQTWWAGKISYNNSCGSDYLEL